MTEPTRIPSVPALEDLGRQFDALESGAKKPRRRWRGVAAAFVAIVGAAAAVAVAPTVADVAHNLIAPTTIENPAPARQAHPETQTHLELPPPPLVRTCEERLEQSPTDQLCQVIILLDRGQLAPGDYTNQELKETLDELLTPDGRLPKPSG